MTLPTERAPGDVFAPERQEHIARKQEPRAHSGLLHIAHHHAPIVVRQPETGSESWLWLDRDGAFVQTLSDTGMAQRRVPEARARAFTGRPPSFGITAPSFPPLERVMSADRPLPGRSPAVPG